MMHFRAFSFLFFILLISAQSGFSQLDSIFDQGSYRTFILHLPAGYNENTEYPIVLNMHGLGSSAIEQYVYSQFHLEADVKGFIVVYPDAINNSWDIFGATDVNFLKHLIDTIRENYSTTDCLFSMGMSQGGFMSYKLTCEFPYEISAIASVTGNMITPWQTSCAGTDPTPVMQFHGTADAVVPYNGTFGIPPIEETMAWWVNENDCNPAPSFTALPDIDPNDGSTAEEFAYGDCDEESNVIFYKIINGSHTWPGAFPIPSFGVTNQDIHASSTIADFFAGYCQPVTSIASPDHIKISTFPNPVSNILTIKSESSIVSYSIFDEKGVIRKSLQGTSLSQEIEVMTLEPGMYFIHVISSDGQIQSMKFVRI